MNEWVQSIGGQNTDLGKYVPVPLLRRFLTNLMEAIPMGLGIIRIKQYPSNTTYLQGGPKVGIQHINYCIHTFGPSSIYYLDGQHV
jgi:hypothetical protein